MQTTRDGLAYAGRTGARARIRSRNAAPLNRARLGTRAAVVLAVAALFVSAMMPLASTVTAAPGTDVVRCTFSNGVVRTLEDGAFKRAEAADLSFDIGAIDLQAQRATLITTRGQAPLRIVRAINANHFLEVVTEGFLNMTTIYAPITTGGRSPAVHSRHFGLLGQPVITQYTGFCDTLK